MHISDFQYNNTSSSLICANEMRHYWKPTPVAHTWHSVLWTDGAGWRERHNWCVALLVLLSAPIQQQNSQQEHNQNHQHHNSWDRTPRVLLHRRHGHHHTLLLLLRTHSHSHYTPWLPLIFQCLTYRKSNVCKLLLIPGLQSSPGPGTHTQSPEWGLQEWLGGHEQVWAQLVPNVPVWHTAKTRYLANVWWTGRVTDILSLIHEYKCIFSWELHYDLFIPKPHPGNLANSLF